MGTGPEAAVCLPPKLVRVQPCNKSDHRRVKSAQAATSRSFGNFINDSNSVHRIAARTGRPGKS